MCWRKSIRVYGLESSIKKIRYVCKIWRSLITYNNFPNCRSNIPTRCLYNSFNMFRVTLAFLPRLTIFQGEIFIEVKKCCASIAAAEYIVVKTSSAICSSLVCPFIRCTLIRKPLSIIGNSDLLQLKTTVAGIPLVILRTAALGLKLGISHDMSKII